MMVAKTHWCELCRFDDPVLARAVATSIAAMEFDVRLCAAVSPFVVEVPGSERIELAEVLDEIIDEQVEFDRMLARRQAAGVRHVRIVMVLTFTGTVELLLLLGSLDL